MYNRTKDELLCQQIAQKEKILLNKIERYILEMNTNKLVDFISKKNFLLFIAIEIKQKKGEKRV